MVRFMFRLTFLLLFSIGGESLAVAQNTYAVLWFRGKELNTVFGLQLSIARVGSMVNFNTISKVYDAVAKKFEGHEALGVTLMLGMHFRYDYS